MGRRDCSGEAAGLDFNQIGYRLRLTEFRWGALLMAVRSEGRCFGAMQSNRTQFATIPFALFSHQPLSKFIRATRLTAVTRGFFTLRL